MRAREGEEKREEERILSLIVMSRHPPWAGVYLIAIPGLGPLKQGLCLRAAAAAAAGAPTMHPRGEQAAIGGRISFEPALPEAEVLRWLPL